MLCCTNTDVILNNCAIHNAIDRAVQCVSCGQNEAPILQGGKAVMGVTTEDLS